MTHSGFEPEFEKRSIDFKLKFECWWESQEGNTSQRSIVEDRRARFYAIF